MSPDPRPLHPALFDIWEEPGTPNPWKAQLVNYVGNFPTKDAAENFIEAVKLHREKATPVVSKTPKRGK